MTVQTWMYVRLAIVRQQLSEGLWAFQRRTIAAEYGDRKRRQYAEAVASLSSPYRTEMEGV